MVGMGEEDVVQLDVSVGDAGRMKMADCASYLAKVKSGQSWTQARQTGLQAAQRVQWHSQGQVEWTMGSQDTGDDVRVLHSLHDGHLGDQRI